jgi:hypothetical protein
MTLPYRSPQIIAYTLTCTGVAQALTDVNCASVLLQADPDNTVNILIGDSSSQTIELSPGGSLSLQIENASLLYAIRDAAGSPVLNYLVLK